MGPLAGRGYLYFSPSRIRYEPFDLARFKKWEFPQTQLKSARRTIINLGSGEIWYPVEIEASRPGGGVGLFAQKLCSVHLSEPDDPRGYQDLLEAANNFEAALERVKAAAAEADAKAKQEAEATAAREAAARTAKLATLRITAQPGGAQVYLDDKFKGVTSESEGVLVIDGLQPASYKVRISYTGYKDWTDSATLAGGETRNLEARLVEAGPKPLTADEVEEALRNGIPNRRVQGFVKQFGVDFALTDEVEKRLRAVGADSDLLLAIAKGKK